MDGNGHLTIAHTTKSSKGYYNRSWQFVISMVIDVYIYIYKFDFFFPAKWKKGVSSVDLSTPRHMTVMGNTTYITGALLELLLESLTI